MPLFLCFYKIYLIVTLPTLHFLLIVNYPVIFHPFSTPSKYIIAYFPILCYFSIYNNH